MQPGGQSNSNSNNVMLDKIQKLKKLLAARGPPPTPPTTPTTTDDGGDNGDNDGVRKYTRQQFDELFKRNLNRSSDTGTGNGGGDGYFDKMFFMFQLYIAFINALMNTANMSASAIFGSLSLQKMFSLFLANVLNMILKTNVGDLTPEQLRDLLEKNRPVLQQISAIIIDEASQLLVGLSDICSNIAMDWVENVLPGLVKSAAMGVPSAVEAAIPPLGEVVEIVTTALALMGSFMKLAGGIQRNVDNVSDGYGRVKGAFESLQKIKDLLNQPPSEIINNATTAVLTPDLKTMAQTALNKFIPSSNPPNVSPSNISLARGGGGRKTKTRRRYLKNSKQFHAYLSKLRKKTAKKELELMNSIQDLKNI